MSQPNPSHPGVVAAAEQTYHTMRGELARFLPMVRAHLQRDDNNAEIDTVCHVFDTLLRQELHNGALLGACAIVALAKQPGQRPHHPRADAR